MPRSNNPTHRITQSRSPDHERRRAIKERGNTGKFLKGMRLLERPRYPEIGKHEHQFVALIYENDIRNGVKYQRVACTVEGCKVSFYREVVW